MEHLKQQMEQLEHHFCQKAVSSGTLGAWDVALEAAGVSFAAAGGAKSAGDGTQSAGDGGQSADCGVLETAICFLKHTKSIRYKNFISNFAELALVFRCSWRIFLSNALF